MSYMGEQPIFGQFPVERFSGDGSTTSFTLTYSPASPSTLLVTISGVKQQATAYSVTDTALDFGVGNAPPSGTNNIEVVYMGQRANVGTAADNTITTAKLTALAVTTAKIAAAAVTVPKVADAVFNANRNIIINGNMSIAQRSTSVQKQYDTSNGYYTCDRVRTTQSNLDDAVWTMTQDSHLLTGPNGFPNSWKVTIDTAETALASDEQFTFSYNIEAFNCQLLAYGTSGAQTTTISFWVKSDVTGVYALVMSTPDSGRNIGGTYTISVADTWEYKTVTFAGDTAGAGINDDNGVGATLYFRLSSGTDRNTTDNTSWAASTTARQGFGQTANLLASATDYWQITGLQFELGGDATPYEHRDFGTELSACKRYFQAPEMWIAHSDSSTATSWKLSHNFPVEMRAAPTITVPRAFSTSKNNANAAGPNAVTTPGTAVATGFHVGSFYIMATGTGSAAATNTPYGGWGGFWADAEIA